MSMRLGMSLPGPFFVSVGGSSRRRSGGGQETKAAAHDRGIKHALKLLNRRSFLREIDLTSDDLDAYGRGKAANAIWRDVVKHTGSHADGFREAADIVQRMNRSYRKIDWAEDVEENDRRRANQKLIKSARRSGHLQWEPNKGCWIHWNGAAWQIWDNGSEAWTDWA